MPGGILTPGGPQNDGMEKGKVGPFKHGQFLVSMYIYVRFLVVVLLLNLTTNLQEIGFSWRVKFFFGVVPSTSSRVRWVWSNYSDLTPLHPKM